MEVFEAEGLVSRACEVVGISRQAAYFERQRNEEFAVAWAEVEERVVETNDPVPRVRQLLDASAQARHG